MATHPRTIERIQRAAAAGPKPPHARNAQKAYQSAIDGMVFGDDPNTGVIRGREFSSVRCVSGSQFRRGLG